jgi:hypothetical protein
VQATRRLVLVRKSARSKPQEQELTIHLADQDGWKVRDVVMDGRSVYASIHQATALAVWLVGLGAFAAFLAVTESVSVAIILPAIVVVGNAACGHYCAVRLERKLARLRASVEARAS